MALNFVKFSRGSATAYAALKRNHNLDNETLYFIYDSTAPEEGGLLYLGDVLIGGTGAAAGATTLNELTDVTITGSLVDGMVLQYNGTAQRWEAASLAESLPTILSGHKAGQQTDNDILTQVDPTPITGDIVFVDDVPYIYNGSSWQLLVGQDLETRVSTLETQMQAVDGKIATAISNANHLSYEVVQTLPTITQQNASDLAKTVFLLPNGETTGDNRYDEFMVVNGNFEKVGNFSSNLSNYVTTTTFNSTVGDLQDSIAALQTNLQNNYVSINLYEQEIGDITDLQTATGDNNITVIDEIINLENRLTWNELDED